MYKLILRKVGTGACEGCTFIVNDRCTRPKDLGSCIKRVGRSKATTYIYVKETWKEDSEKASDAWGGEQVDDTETTDI